MYSSIVRASKGRRKYKKRESKLTLKCDDIKQINSLNQINGQKSEDSNEALLYPKDDITID